MYSLCNLITSQHYCRTCLRPASANDVMCYLRPVESPTFSFGLIEPLKHLQECTQEHQTHFQNINPVSDTTSLKF